MDPSPPGAGNAQAYWTWAVNACYDLGARIAVAWQEQRPPVGAWIWFAAALIQGLLRRARPDPLGPPPFEVVVRTNPAFEEHEVEEV